jgi:hypothetical protein
MRDAVDHPVASSALEGLFLEALVGVEPANSRHSLPRAVRAELPGENVVGQQGLEYL